MCPGNLQYILFLRRELILISIGNRFGLAQSKAGLVTILCKYSIHLHHKIQTSPFEISNTTFLTSTKNGIWLSFQKRQ